MVAVRQLLCYSVVSSRHLQKEVDGGEGWVGGDGKRPMKSDIGGSSWYRVRGGGQTVC